MKDILRVAAAVPRVSVGNVAYNEEKIAEKIGEAESEGVSVLVFPECALTGYSCGDLFFQKSLQKAAEEALLRLCRLVPERMLVAVGTPLLIDGALYNVAVWLAKDKPVAIIPKAFLPNYREHAERRHFTPASQLKKEAVRLGGFTVPCGALLLESEDGIVIGTEICEDLFAPIPPSSRQALSGATVLCNLCACNETVGKRALLRSMIAEQSRRSVAAYLFASAGWHESTSDLLYAGYSAIAQNGKLVAENKELISDNTLLITDLDMGRTFCDRTVNRTFGEAAAEEKTCLARVLLEGTKLFLEDVPTHLSVSPTPFIARNEEKRENACRDIFEIQAHALARRLEITGGRLVIGVSGGLDSTLALLVATRSMDILNLPRTNIYALTLPCFGTTDTTRSNAWALMRALGVNAEEIRIAESVNRHFADIGHDPDVHDVTYENSQARERTQVLMDYANRVGAIVLGTGDLSELALGWCTYNADHMSMYGVNAGVPKTLIAPMPETLAKDARYAPLKDILLAVVNTPVSPELLPPDENGKIAQKTEDLVGPYRLHDFFIYYAVRYGYEPKKIEELARLAFQGEFSEEIIHRWLENFYRRFFSQQFKRNCLPDGVKIGSVGFSPRGDLQMPADASNALWLRALADSE